MELKLDSVWGIEIGANGFNAVLLKKSKGAVIIKSFHVYSYDKSIEGDEDIVSFAKQGLMSLFAEGVIKKKDNVFVSIPGRSIFSRPIELPPMDMSKFHELIKYEASQQIPHDLSDVVWDYHLDSSDDNVNAILFAAHRDDVDRITNIFSEAGLQIAGIQSSTLAILNYFRHDVDFDKSAVLMDVKSKNIDFVVNDGIRFWQRNIARGGDDINKALMTKFKIPFTQAEELKRNMSGGQQAEKISQVIQPVFKVMSNEIQRSIGHYTNQNEETQIQDAFLLGNAHRMNALLEYFKMNLRLNIHVINKLGRLAENCEVDLETINKHHGDLAVPLGLAIQGLGQSSINTNLLPPEIIQGRIARKRSKWLVLACVMFLIGGGYHFSQLKSAQAELKTYTKKKKSPKTEAARIVAIENHLNKERKKPPIVIARLKKWKDNLYSPETAFDRTEWIRAVDEFNKLLFFVPEDKKNNIFLDELRLIEAEDKYGNAWDNPRYNKKAAKRATATKPYNIKPKMEKIFRFEIKGTFYSRAGKNANDPKNIEFMNKNIIYKLNGNKNFYRWGSSGLAPERDQETNVWMCRYSIDGYYVAPKEDPANKKEGN